MTLVDDLKVCVIWRGSGRALIKYSKGDVLVAVGLEVFEGFGEHDDVFSGSMKFSILLIVLLLENSPAQDIVQTSGCELDRLDVRSEAMVSGDCDQIFEAWLGEVMTEAGETDLAELLCGVDAEVFANETKGSKIFGVAKQSNHDKDLDRKLEVERSRLWGHGRDLRDLG
jgi:hypothetical protein